MIYIIGDEDGFPKSVYNGRKEDLGEYKKFLIRSSEQMNVVINVNYYNMMDKTHHEHLNDETYRFKRAEWSAYLRTFTFEWFLRTQKRKQVDFRLV